mmetsp:Transcript_49101/g.116976  ORF Transcript_49101/g.116976 Transcript_49101/m.116976 type:complete len:397 (+) Transcript_49101:285-1475(+)
MLLLLMLLGLCLLRFLLRGLCLLLHVSQFILLGCQRLFLRDHLLLQLLQLRLGGAHLLGRGLPLLLQAALQILHLLLVLGNLAVFSLLGPLQLLPQLLLLLRLHGRLLLGDLLLVRELLFQALHLLHDLPLLDLHLLRDLLFLLLHLLQVLLLHQLYLLIKGLFGFLSLLLQLRLRFLELLGRLPLVLLRTLALSRQLLLGRELLQLRLLLLLLQKPPCRLGLPLQLEKAALQRGHRLVLARQQGGEVLHLLLPHRLLFELLLVALLLLFQLQLHLLRLILLLEDLDVEFGDFLLHLVQLVVRLVHLRGDGLGLRRLILCPLLLLLSLRRDLCDPLLQLRLARPGLLKLLVHGREEGLDPLGLAGGLLELLLVGLVHVRHHLLQVLAALFQGCHTV